MIQTNEMTVPEGARLSEGAGEAKASGDDFLGPTATRWGALRAETFSGNVEEVRQRLPRFRRDAGDFGRHPTKELMVREPDGVFESPVPIGMVSPTYQLIQHAEVLGEMAGRVRRISGGEETAEVTVTLAGIGERVMFRMDLGERFAMAPDNEPNRLELLVINSVDGTSAVRARLGWYRLVCSNGMFVGVSLGRVRMPHCPEANLRAAFEPIERQLRVARKERERFERWTKREVRRPALEKWVDGPVSRLWGPLAASRVFQICQTGRDARFADPFEPAPPSARRMVPTREVPGCCAPADNAYAVSQALSWVASRRRNLEQVTLRQHQIGRLMRWFA